MSSIKSSTNCPSSLAIFYIIHPLLCTQLIIFKILNVINRNALIHFCTSTVIHPLIILIFYWYPLINLFSSYNLLYPYHFSLLIYKSN